MAICKAQVHSTASFDKTPVMFTLVDDNDGFTYEISGMTGENLRLNWHEPTADKASEHLQQIYGKPPWRLEIIEQR